MNDLVNFYFSFKGRATRYDFNIRYAFVVCLGSILAGILDYLVFGASVFVPGSSTIISNAWNLFALIASLAVTCRRLHDMNISGWWQLIVYFIPSILLMVCFFSVGLAFLTDPLAAGLGGFLAILAVLFFYLFFFIFLSTKRGTNGPNKYGSDPLQITNFETIA